MSEKVTPSASMGSSSEYASHWLSLCSGTMSDSAAPMTLMGVYAQTSPRRADACVAGQMDSRPSMTARHSDRMETTPAVAALPAAAAAAAASGVAGGARAASR